MNKIYYITGLNYDGEYHTRGLMHYPEHPEKVRFFASREIAQAYIDTLEAASKNAAPHRSCLHGIYPELLYPAPIIGEAPLLLNPDASTRAGDAIGRAYGDYLTYLLKKERENTRLNAQKIFDDLPWEIQAEIKKYIEDCDAECSHTNS